MKHRFVYYVVGVVLVGCSPKVVEPVQVVELPHIEKHIEIQRDSLIIQDSIWTVSREKIWSEGDSTFIERETETNRTHLERSISHDTICIVDSVTTAVPYYITEYIDKPLTWWQKALMWTGAISIICIILALFIKLRI